MGTFVPEQLREAAKIYEKRNALYGDNYIKWGGPAKLLMQGFEYKTERDYARMCLFVQILAKLTRYASQFNKGGHADSLSDLAVYAMMLQELDSGVPGPDAHIAVADPKSNPTIRAEYGSDVTLKSGNTIKVL